MGTDKKVWEACEHMFGDEATVAMIDELAVGAQCFIESEIERIRAEKKPETAAAK